MKTSFNRAIADDVDVAIASNLPIGRNDRPRLELVQQEIAAPRGKLEFWESERTRPEYTCAGDDSAEYFRNAGLDYLKRCMAHPYLPVAQIKQMQFERIYDLVEMAYSEIPVYQDKYKAAGFSPSDLRSYDDIEKIPVITKPELIAAFPTRCLNPRYSSEDLFATRSSGSSGQTLLIRVDYDAVLTDTIQGIRQFALQAETNDTRPEDAAGARLHRAVVVRLGRRKISDGVHIERHPAGAGGSAPARDRATDPVLLSVEPRGAAAARRPVQLGSVSRRHSLGILLAPRPHGVGRAAGLPGARRIQL